MSLQTMNNKWEYLNITNYFVDIHHFSSDESFSFPIRITTSTLTYREM